MKAVLCYGDSLTWGYNPRTGGRYDFADRWPGVLQHELGASVRVIEEALNGRCASTSSWLLPHRDGRDLLPPLLEAHAPLDAVILMLGVNDCAPTAKRTAEEIAMGCWSMLLTIQKSQTGPGGAAPKALLIAPPPLEKPAGMMALFFAGGEAKSRQLAPLYRDLAASAGVAFLDAGAHVQASAADGCHLDLTEQRRLGHVIAMAAKQLLE